MIRLYVRFKRWQLRRKMRRCGCGPCLRNLESLEILWADQDNAIMLRELEKRMGGR